MSQRIHYTFPHAQSICIGCLTPMPYEIVMPPPMLKLAVACENKECIYFGHKFEVLPILLKPYEDEKKEKLISSIYQ